jgi:two-component system LytT family response regulator
VVFVTAYPQYAADAFAVEAADYLLKPVEPERLAESLDRVRRRLAQAHGLTSGPSQGASELIELKTPRRTVLAAPARSPRCAPTAIFTRVLLADRPEVMIWRTLGPFREPAARAALPAPRPLADHQPRPAAQHRGSIARGRAAHPARHRRAAGHGRTASQRLREALAADKSGPTP